MFIGHYAPAFLGKRIAKTVPLWVLFAAVQLVDIAWGIFIATGIEHVRIIEASRNGSAVSSSVRRCSRTG